MFVFLFLFVLLLNNVCTFVVWLKIRDYMYVYIKLFIKECECLVRITHNREFGIIIVKPLMVYPLYRDTAPSGHYNLT